jgi:hypothetical protein
MDPRFRRGFSGVRIHIDSLFHKYRRSTSTVPLRVDLRPKTRRPHRLWGHLTQVALAYVVPTCSIRMNLCGLGHQQQEQTRSSANSDQSSRAAPATWTPW